MQSRRLTRADISPGIVTERRRTDFELSCCRRTPARRPPNPKGKSERSAQLFDSNYAAEALSLGLIDKNGSEPLAGSIEPHLDCFPRSVENLRSFVLAQPFHHRQQ